MDKDRKFAENAFEEAVLNNGGWKAFQKVAPTTAIRFIKVCEIVGWDNAGPLIELIEKHGQEDTFTKLWYNMFITGFVAGYTSRKTEEAEEAAKTTK